MTTLTLVTTTAASDRSSYERAWDALEAAGCKPRARGESGLDACCPSHDDADASLSGDWKPGTADRSGAMFLKCHAASGCTFDTILDALGLRRADMFDGLSPEYAAKRGTAAPSPRRRAASSPKAPPAKPGRTKEPKPKADHEHDFAHEATHVYANTDGVIVAKIHRKRCQVPGCREKTFRTGYPNGKPADGLPLYGTPELADAIADGRTIHICEGEGDRDTLTAAGAVAVSAPFGADSGEGDKWLPLHTEQLRGARSVVIWTDRDTAGLRHAGYVANQLLAASALHAEPTPNGYGVTIDLRIVYPAVTTPKADASDHFAAGHGIDDAVNVPPADLASTGLQGLATMAEPTAPAAENTSDDNAAEDRKKPAEPGQPPRGSTPIEGSFGWRYSTTAGHRGGMWKMTGRGENREWEPVLGWAPVTNERLVKLNDDGTIGAKHFTITVGSDTNTVPVADLRTGEAWDRYPEAIGTASKPVKEALFNCVETQGQHLPRTPVVTHTGWYDLPEIGRTYIYADGRTYPEGRAIRVLDVPDKIRQAAAPLDRTADDDECRQAVVDIACHGWAGLFGLAVGARSLGWSLYPLAASWAIVGGPNSGKTQAGNIGRSLMFTPRPKPWPPVVTKGMSSTPTDIECAVDLEGDTPLLLDDVALTRASTAMEVRDVTSKLELVLRGAGNMTEMRGRRNRDLSARPGKRARAVPVIAAQMLPPSMQESLYRRTVITYVSPEGGEVDWRWYRDEGGAALAVPLRTIGDRIIAHLHGLEDPAAYLVDLEEKVLKQFAPYVEAVLPEASGSMDGVVKAAAGMLSGLGLVATVADVEMDALISVVAGPLASSLAKQAAKMSDQSEQQDDLGTAVVELIRQALATGRAHVRDDKGVIGPAIPGEVEQVQGVTKAKDGSDTWEGRGPAFYWLPDKGDKGPAFGVRTAELHTLLKASSDPRVQGIGQRTLPDQLLQAGLTIRNERQKGRKGVHQIRVGSDNPRLLLIRAERVWDLGTPGDTDGGDDGRGPDDGGSQPPSTEPPGGEHANTAENHYTNAAENNGYNGDNGYAAGQADTQALFDPAATENGDTAGQSPSPDLDTLPGANGDNAVTSTVTAVAVPSARSGYTGDHTAPAARTENGDHPSTQDPKGDNMTTDTDDFSFAPCVECGRPTPCRDADGTPRHVNIPGVFSCTTGFAPGQSLATIPSPASPPEDPAAPEPAAAPEPTGPQTPAPRPVTAAGPAAPRRRSQAPAPQTDDVYPNGPLAVLDVTDEDQVLAHLVDGRTLDVPARSINTLVTWALQAGLGQTRLHKWGTDGDPLLVLTPAATKKFGLPAELEDRSNLRLADNHKVIKALNKAGWSLTKRGFGPWARIYKPVQDGRRMCVQLAVIPWDALGKASGWYMDDDTNPAEIARTLGTFAQRVIAPRGTMASSGVELMLQLRPETRPVKVETTDETTGKVTETYVSGPVEGSLTKPRKPAPCEAPDEHPVVHEHFGTNRPEEEVMREEAWSWHRAAEGDELDFPSCVGIDTNTSFLSGSSRLLVGDSDPVHHVRPAFDPKTPGAWKVDFSRAHLDLARRLPAGQVNPLDPRLPSPFTPNGESPTGPRWYTTQTCDYARKLGITVEPIEAWLRAPLGAGWLDPWNERLSVAYKTTMARLGVTEDMSPQEFLEAMARIDQGEGDPAERTVLKAIKQSVKSGIGKLRTTPGRYPGYKDGDPWPDLDKPWWRPDIRASVISTARIVQHRKIVKTFQLTGRAPLAAYSDCVIYPTTSCSPLEIIPRDGNGQQIRGAFRLGVAPGWAKLEGTRSLDWYTATHNDGANPARYIAPRDGERIDEGE
ncbi:telomere-associated protein Tap [Streptomyces sp. NPDC001262]|uniref:telomere-associated protein Tap n=1 Tax=Streptomyces sp. NPDC001262 TaxID=3364552 RepID=UPI00368879F1